MSAVALCTKVILILAVFCPVNVVNGANLRPAAENSSKSTDDPAEIQSLIQYKIPEENVAAVNKQINLEYSALYAYDAMAAFFDSAANPMPGCSKLFLKQADRQLNNARMLMSFLNMKGGKLFLPDIKAPTVSSWDSCTSALQDALRIEIQIRYALHDLAKRAGKEFDVAFTKLASEMIYVNAKSIKHIADITRQFGRVSSPEGKPNRNGGEFIVDKELQKDDEAFSSPSLAHRSSNDFLPSM